MQLGRTLKHGRGKIRRYFLLRFRQGYVDRRFEARKGGCNQCGNCCEIMFKCPFFIRHGSTTLCSIYDDRPGQCAAFPIDEKCLSEVDFECSYSFGKEPHIGVETPARDETPMIEPGEVAERFLSTRPIPILFLAWLIARLPRCGQHDR